MAIKNITMDELYSLSRSIGPAGTKQIDQTSFIGNMAKNWEKSSNKNIIIKTVLVNFNAITNAFYKSSDKSIDNNYKYGRFLSNWSFKLW